MIEREDELLGRLLTDHLPAVPADIADTPPRGLRAKARARRRRAALVAGSAVAVAAIAAGAVVTLGRPASPRSGVGGSANQTAGPAAGTLDSGQVFSAGGKPAASPPPGAQLTKQPIERANLSADGRTLTITYITGDPSCYGSTIVVGEEGSQVVLTLESWIQGGNNRVCTAIAMTGRLSVLLHAPLRGREVVDGSTGRPVAVQDLTERRTPHFLPPGCKDSPLLPDTQWGAACDGGGYAVRYYQNRPAEAAQTFGDSSTVLAQRTVHGQPATLTRWTTPPKIDPSTGKPYTNPATGRPYEPTRIVALTWTESGYRFAVAVYPAENLPYHKDDLIHLAQQVADSVR